MPLVKVQKKGQVTLPTRLRAQAGLSDGDLLEAKLERGKIILIPKSVVDRQIAESVEDYRKGRFYGPFDSAGEMIVSLKANLKKRARKQLSRK